jgi:hypothetical protein
MRDSGRKGVLVPGLVLIAVGVWFLIRSLGYNLPGMAQMWPVFPVIVGLSMFVTWLVSPDKLERHGLMIPAVINFLVGVFFFGFTLSFFQWSDMADLWPVFPLIVGVAFIVAWIFSLFRDWGMLIPGGITAGVGIVGLAYTLYEQNAVIAPLLPYWPVLLIGFGLLILIGAVLNPARQTSSQDSATQEFKEPDNG